MQVLPPPGYNESDILQSGNQESCRATSTDVRSAFQHDVDRILYSTEFRSLAGKTQVIASDQLGGYHNRLTHSLKVAQIGKRMAVMLTERFNAEHRVELPGPAPDLVEAAGLLHDIGHPPFGHIGEVAIREGVQHLNGTPRTDAFQANAQNLRIATYLGVKRHRDYRGLNLTRATLNASIKYPWTPGEAPDANAQPSQPKPYGYKHWGCYEDETSKDALRWVLDNPDAPFEPPTVEPNHQDADQGLRRPVEEQIMDWADEVTYACHDVEDFYRAGMLPLDQVFDGVPSADARKGERNDPGYETDRFIKHLVTAEKFDRDRAIKVLQNLRNKIGKVFPFEATVDGRGRSTMAVSSLITYFMGAKPPEDDADDNFRLMLVSLDDSGFLTGYHAALDIHEDLRDACRILNAMIWFYVIDRPGLATQQRGQVRIVTDLIDWYANDPKRLLPRDRHEEWEEHGDAVRAAADAVAGFTEAEAVRVHRRMSGIDWGQITDIA